MAFHRRPRLSREDEDDGGAGLPCGLLGQRQRERALRLRTASPPHERGDRTAVAGVVEERGRRRARELRQVLAPVGQRRDLEREGGIQAHQQVGAKARVAGRAGELRVGGRDDPRGVRRLGRAPDAADLPVVQRRQQHLLCVRSEVLDLVEKERPVGRRFEDALPIADRTGERAAQRAEER